MSKIKFEKVKEDKVLDSIWFNIEYMSGDADAYDYEKQKLKFKFSEWKEHEDEIQEMIKEYKQVSHLTDINHKDFYERRFFTPRKEEMSYEEIEEKYGERVAQIFDNTPGDSTNDHDGKAYLESVTLQAYDDKGFKYETYNLL